MPVPNPGSSKAVEAGCTCPRIDNSWGNGFHRPADGGPVLFVIASDCPLHDKPDTITKEESPNASS